MLRVEFRPCSYAACQFYCLGARMSAAELETSLAVKVRYSLLDVSIMFLDWHKTLIVYCNFKKLHFVFLALLTY